MSKKRICDPQRDIFLDTIRFARIDWLVASCLMVFAAIVTLLTGTVLKSCLCFCASPLLVFAVADGNPAIVMLGLVMTVALPVLCFLCWGFSEHRFGWLTAAFVIFAADSLAFLVAACVWWDMECVLYLLYRISCLYPLCMGIYSVKQLKKQQQKIDRDINFRVDEQNAECEPFSTPLYEVQANEKARILAQKEVHNHQVCYRRVKTVNELVVDGMVYDRVEMLAELPHCLTACVDGHVFHATLSITGFSTLWVDGEAVAKKFRMI
jgi:hypothetical protein